MQLQENVLEVQILYADGGGVGAADRLEQLRRRVAHAHQGLVPLDLRLHRPRHREARRQRAARLNVQTLDRIFELVQLAVVDDFSLAQDGDAVGDALQVGGDVRGEQDRPPAVVGDVQQRAEEIAPGGGIEAGGGLVENEQLRFVTERQHDCELLQRADGEDADLVVAVDVPVREQARDQLVVPPRIERRRVVDQMPHPHPRVKRDDLRHVADLRLRVGREVPRRFAEQFRVAGGGADQPEGGLDQRRLPRRVLSEQTAPRSNQTYRLVRFPFLTNSHSMTTRLVCGDNYRVVHKGTDVASSAPCSSGFRRSSLHPTPDSEVES